MNYVWQKSAKENKRMKQQTKKLLRVLLTLVMLIGLLPTAALAASEIDKVELTCTRAQIVTFLWRAAGSPEPKSSAMPFEDVAADAYYYDAVLWAVENGITAGTTAATFAPNATCTRAQIVTFLWRSQRSPAADSGIPSPTWRLTPTTTPQFCGLLKTASPAAPVLPPSAPAMTAPAPRS